MRDQLTRAWQKARNTDGAVDLASIMVGIIVLGVVAGIIAATVFGVIPWAQNNAAQQSLRSVQTAEAVAMAKENPPGQYYTTQELADLHYLPQSAVATVAAGLDIRGGRGASVASAAAPIDPDPNKAVVATNAARSCYVAAIKSGTGEVFYTTSDSPDIIAAKGVTPDTTSCVAFPIVVHAAGSTDGSGGGSTPAVLADPIFAITAQAGYYDAVNNPGHAEYELTGQLTCPAEATSGSWRATYSVDGGATWSNEWDPMTAMPAGSSKMWQGTFDLDSSTEGKTATFHVTTKCSAPGYTDSTKTIATSGSFSLDLAANLPASAPVWSSDTSGQVWHQLYEDTPPVCPAGMTEWGDYNLRYLDADGMSLGEIPATNGSFQYYDDDRGVPGSATQVLSYQPTCRLDTGGFTKFYRGPSIDVLTEVTWQAPEFEAYFRADSTYESGRYDGDLAEISSWLIQKPDDGSTVHLMNVPIVDQLSYSGQSQVRIDDAVIRTATRSEATTSVVVKPNYESSGKAVGLDIEIWTNLTELNTDPSDLYGAQLIFSYGGKTNTIYFQ